MSPSPAFTIGFTCDALERHFRTLMQKFGGSAAFINRKERTLILLLCLAAAVRIFVFCAAFPFFTEVDEDLHFDLIMRYSLGQMPRTFDLLSKESLDWIVPYASPEFLQRPNQFPEGKFPPPLWKQSGPDDLVMSARQRLEEAGVQDRVGRPLTDIADIIKLDVRRTSPQTAPRWSSDMAPGAATGWRKKWKRARRRPRRRRSSRVDRSAGAS